MLLNVREKVSSPTMLPRREKVVDARLRPTKVNKAISLMVDYARHRNLSNCWLCQNMPTSIHSPMSSPIPFSKADYEQYNWNDLNTQFEDLANECYTPTYPVDAAENSKYAFLAQEVTQTINDQYLPIGFKRVTLLKVIHVQMYVHLGFQYRVQMVLVQTNCTAGYQEHNCEPQPYTNVALVEHWCMSNPG